MMYQKCLLYAPIQDEAELLQADIKEKYLKLNDEDNNVVAVNERKMFQFKIMTENTEFPEENDIEDDTAEDEPHIDEDVDPSEFALDQLLELL